MKGSKTKGVDGIAAEMLKCRGEEVLEWMLYTGCFLIVPTNFGDRLYNEN